MENVPHQLTEQIWHKIIGLQYECGDLSDLKELEHLTGEDFRSIIRYLLSHGYLAIRSIDRLKTGSYFVTDFKNKSKIPKAKFYLPENSFHGSILQRYIDNALTSLSNLVVNTIPLDAQTNPPGIKAELVNESSRLRELKERLENKVLIDTIQAERDEDKDGDRDKFRFKLKKEDGVKILFITQFSDTWRASNRSVTDAEIIQIMGNKISEYIHECEDLLPGVIYNLRCICATSSHGEDGIQISSLEEVEHIPMKSLIYKYE